MCGTFAVVAVEFFPQALDVVKQVVVAVDVVDFGLICQVSSHVEPQQHHVGGLALKLYLPQNTGFP
jgi:hypothetical protein